MEKLNIDYYEYDLDDLIIALNNKDKLIIDLKEQLIKCKNHIINQVSYLYDNRKACDALIKDINNVLND